MPQLPQQPTKKLKPLDVHIVAMNTVPMMMQNNLTQEGMPVFNVFGLGSDNVVYTYNNHTKEWSEM